VWTHRHHQHPECSHTLRQRYQLKRPFPRPNPQTSTAIEGKIHARPNHSTHGPSNVHRNSKSTLSSPRSIMLLTSQPYRSFEGNQPGESRLLNPKNLNAPSHCSSKAIVLTKSNVTSNCSILSQLLLTRAVHSKATSTFPPSKS
jgi:hypothetical protein